MADERQNTGLRGVYRMIDANRNRVAEGLRVIEDLTRFYWEDPVLTELLRGIRHKVRKNLTGMETDMLSARSTGWDPGREISARSGLDRKTDFRRLVAANFRRAEEGIRVIEEGLHRLKEDETAKKYEELRFRLYDLEKTLFFKEERKDRLAFLENSFYGITAEEYSSGRTNAQVVAEMLAAGVRIIQYREKEKKMKEKYREAKILRRMTKENGALFLINDNVDLALMVRADGVHLGQDDLPLPEARDLLGPRMIIGVSTHSPTQARQAVEEGADYIGAGPLYPTATKKDVVPAVGLEYLRFVLEKISIPVVAIGGIKESNLKEVCRCGARCVAMVTEIVGAKEIGEKVRHLRLITKNYWGG